MSRNRKSFPLNLHLKPLRNRSQIIATKLDIVVLRKVSVCCIAGEQENVPAVDSDYRVPTPHLGQNYNSNMQNVSHIQDFKMSDFAATFTGSIREHSFTHNIISLCLWRDLT